MAKRRKKVGYPALPPARAGVKRKLFGGKEARLQRQADRQERRQARQDARAQAKEDGVGFFGRIGAGIQAGRDVREQQQLEAAGPAPEEMEETAPEMTGAVGGGVDTSAAGVGMDTGGMAAQRGGPRPEKPTALKDRRKRRRARPMFGKRKAVKVANQVADGVYEREQKRQTGGKRISRRKAVRKRR